MLPVLILPAARLDLLEQAEYYDSEGGEDLGNRFVANCETGFARLAAFPESGTRVRLKHPKLKYCRFILAAGFEKIMIFYKLSDNKVQIVRVLHGARDIEPVLDSKMVGAMGWTSAGFGSPSGHLRHLWGDTRQVALSGGDSLQFYENWNLITDSTYPARPGDTQE